MPEKDATQRIEDLRQAAARMRAHAIRMTSEAGSGHPTTSLSAADLVSVLFFHVLRMDPKNPADPRNDRFVLSKGHGAPILYAAWAEAGLVEPEEVLRLRRIDSDLEGHPTPRLPWVDVATGSLGQGLSAGLGMALGARMEGLASRIYVLLGDGETAEGAVWEAAAVASHYGVDNLVAIVDVNRLGQSQATMLEHDLGAYERRFGAFGWHAIVIDGHDYGEIVSAFDEASRVRGRPTAILAKTIKGKGVSFLQNEDGWHGKALPKGEEMEKALAELGTNGDGRSEIRPLEDGIVGSRPGRRAPIEPETMAPPEHEIGAEVATRAAYGTALRKLGEASRRVVALDGDVKNSTKADDFRAAHPDRFVESFIAEQNMVGMAMGLSALGFVPFVSTFACFLTRAFDHIRMAGISRSNVKLCGSHAGVSIGEDGPSQMGLEDLAMMRTIPGSVVLYPSDAVSTERLVALAASHEGIVYLRTSRPKTPVLYPNDEPFEIGGCKVLRASAGDRATVVAAGITLHEALKAHDELAREGIPFRVIDLYSVKPLPAKTLIEAAAGTNRTILTVEDHYEAGGIGEAVLAEVGAAGVRVERLAVRGLPRSGAPEALLDAFDIDARAIVRTVRGLVSGRESPGEHPDASAAK